MNEKNIIYDYLNGHKVVEITSKYKISSATLSKLLKKYGIQTRYKNKENKNNIYIEHFLFNTSFKELAEKYNISIPEAKQYYYEERDKKIIYSYQNNETINDMCDKFGLSNMGIYKILNKHNIERRAKRKEKRKYRTLNEDEKEEIFKEYQSGTVSVYSLIENYDISKYQLYNLIEEKNGVKRRSKNKAE